ncbi:hypothetical protein M011DRAFT_473784 [Sporormia fimetaria CBS 119925]|uniref:Uncharacterized protein n=1 Tax=Sporormia fimetaria CBS 119925 TaxID=1340428 RepID=A0A6A6VNH3_9PLEO|nr:hypothetical protein M011DRAFT_473784 [Sporormia fimetaria CBS 119925]
MSRTKHSCPRCSSVLVDKRSVLRHMRDVCGKYCDACAAIGAVRECRFYKGATGCSRCCRLSLPCTRRPGPVDGEPIPVENEHEGNESSVLSEGSSDNTVLTVNSEGSTGSTNFEANRVLNTPEHTTATPQTMPPESLYAQLVAASSGPASALLVRRMETHGAGTAYLPPNPPHPQQHPSMIHRSHPHGNQFPVISGVTASRQYSPTQQHPPKPDGHPHPNNMHVKPPNPHSQGNADIPASQHSHHGQHPLAQQHLSTISGNTLFNSQHPEPLNYHIQNGANIAPPKHRQLLPAQQHPPTATGCPHTNNTNHHHVGFPQEPTYAETSTSNAFYQLASPQHQLMVPPMFAIDDGDVGASGGAPYQTGWQRDQLAAANPQAHVQKPQPGDNIPAHGQRQVSAPELPDAVIDPALLTLSAQAYTEGTTNW